MNYLIHKLDLIRPTVHRNFFEAEVKKHVKRLERFLKRYKKELYLDIYVKKEGRSFHHITAALSTKHRPVIVDEKGDSIQLLDGLFDRLRVAAEEQIRMEKGQPVIRKIRGNLDAKARLLYQSDELEE